MKLKHYYNMYYSRLKESEEVLAESAFTSIMNKLCKIHGKSLTNNYKIDSKTDLSDMNGILGMEYDSVVASLYAMGLEDKDYFKYYMLDKLTNGMFVDMLITSIYRHHRQGQFFIFLFNRNSFTEPASQPTVIVEYRPTEKGSIDVPMIVYSNPFNGDMVLEDFLSMAMTDPIYLLNPERNSKYLLEKIASGVSCIPYSQEKILNIVGLPQTTKDSSYISWYIKDIPGNLLLRITGKPVVNVISMSRGKFILNGEMGLETDISLLTKNIYQI